MPKTEVDVSKRANALHIGVQGEIDAEVFEFDISTWQEEYGSTGGSASIDLQRPGEATSYTKNLPITNGKATWTVDDTDNAVAGQGRAQLAYFVPGTKKKKTAEYVTIIERALDEQHGDTPDPYESYLVEARDIARGARDSQNAAAASAAEASHHVQEAADAQDAAEDAAEAAAASAARAEAVFSVAGDAVFAVNSDSSVTLIFTEEE